MVGAEAFGCLSMEGATSRTRARLLPGRRRAVDFKKPSNSPPRSLPSLWGHRNRPPSRFLWAMPWLQGNQVGRTREETAALGCAHDSG